MNNNITKRVFRIFLVLFSLAILYWLAFNIRYALSNGTNRKGYDTVLKDMDICTLALQGDVILAGGTSGVFRVDKDTLVTEEIGNYQYVRAILVVDDGIWIGHDNGLTFIGDKTITYTTKNRLPDNRVNALMLDDHGKLWAGTWGGAVRLDDDQFTVYTTQDGLADNMVNVIMQDHFGGIWFGSYVAPRGGISIYHNQQWQCFTTKDGLIHSNVNAIIETFDGSVLVGGGLYTKGGGTRFTLHDNRWKINETVTKADGLAGKKIRSLFQDSRHRLWAGSEYDGLAVIGQNSTVILNKTGGLPNNEVKDIEEDEAGNMWIGTRGGLTRITKGGFEDEWQSIESGAIS